jgi:ribonuclease Z
MVAQCKDYEGQFHVYGNDKVQFVIRIIIDMILAKKQLAKVAERVVFHELHNGDTFEVGNIGMQCFDIHSTKEKQYGFRAELPGTIVVCLGDEPYNSQNRQLVEHADWLLCEAFCLYADREEFKPYEKSHSTALDAGKLATELGVKSLLLYHTEEKTLATRCETYICEAAQHFKGGIVVPNDLEVVKL